jgi:hypothetical protein
MEIDFQYAGPGHGAENGSKPPFRADGLSIETLKPQMLRNDEKGSN